MLLALQLGLALLVGASAAYYALCALATWNYFRPTGPSGDGSSLPASILIPVCGLEDGAEGKWESFCRQDHPEFEVLFGVRDPEDPALPVLRKLAERYPGRVRWFVRPEVLGTNYQISNLIHLFREARFPAIVISDSDMRAEPGYLRTVVAPLSNSEVGLVTCGYKNNQPRGLGAVMATLGRCVDFIPQVLLARALDGRFRFALGATLAMRRDVLEKIGGLESVVNRIGSDYHLGKQTSAAGYRVVLSQYVLENDAGPESVDQVYRRELRWARTIRMNRGPQFYGLGLTHGTLYSVPLLAIAHGCPWLLSVCALAWGFRLLQAATTIHYLKAPGLFRWLWSLPVRDMLNFAVWLVSILGNDVQWRGRRLRLRPGGVLDDPRTT